MAEEKDDESVVAEFEDALEPAKIVLFVFFGGYFSRIVPSLLTFDDGTDFP